METAVSLMVQVPKEGVFGLPRATWTFKGWHSGFGTKAGDLGLRMRAWGLRVWEDWVFGFRVL